MVPKFIQSTTDTQLKDKILNEEKITVKLVMDQSEKTLIP